MQGEWGVSDSIIQVLGEWLRIQPRFQKWDSVDLKKCWTIISEEC